MTRNEVMAMMAEMETPFAYHHFVEGESPNPPFLCFLYPNEDGFEADDQVYFHVPHLDLEVYTDLKDPDLEARVEETLDAPELYYEKTEVWIESEKLYEFLYSVTI